MMIAPPFWSAVAASQATLLLYFDGANNSTTFIDSSPNAIAFTAVGNAKITTGDSVDGVACGIFDGSGDRIESGAESVLMITGDFTLEGWVKAPSGSFGTLASIQHTAPTNQTLNLTIAGGTLVANSLGMTGTTTITDDVWHYVAMSRQTVSPTSHFKRLFIDGGMEVEVDSLTLGPAHTVAPNAYFGGAPSATVLNGKLDQWRLTKSCLYTASFTPPTPPLS